MILLFLGSWRSTVIILIEIPLAILFALTLLSAFGETINVMALGGLALAPIRGLARPIVCAPAPKKNVASAASLPRLALERAALLPRR